MATYFEDFVSSLFRKLEGKTIKSHIFTSPAQTKDAWRAKPCVLCANPRMGESVFCLGCIQDGSALAYASLITLLRYFEEQQQEAAG